MTETKVKISSVVKNQLPQFVKEEFPLVSEFLSQYYISIENQGGTSDLLQNIDQYVKVDNLTNLIDSTTLSSDLTFFDTVINVESTAGFPDSYGLLLIDSEIVTYTSKTSSSFDGCVRGFSGITSYGSKDELIFTETDSEEHISGSVVNNLSILFLKQFFTKIKKQFVPGFENRELYSELNSNLFIKQSIDFYSSKGTDNSFKILFGALYGENVEVIKPRDYLIKPSDAQYRITNNLVVESIEGNPEDLTNTTLYQDKTDFINAAQGTVTNVEKIRRGNKDYYVISLDSDYDKDIQPIGTIYGKFTIHPKTKVVSPIISGSTTLEVDSTVGFPNTNGNLIVDLENGSSLVVNYTSKTLNQFLGCSGINQDIPESTDIKLDAFASSKNKDIRIRILGVLSDLEIPKNATLYSKGDTIRIKTLGIDLDDYKSINWFYNIPIKYEIESITLLDSSDLSYKIDVYDNHLFKVGETATLITSDGQEIVCFINLFNSEKSFNIQLGSEQPPLNLDLIYTIKKSISKFVSNYSLANQYTSDVQNTYSDKESLYVASSSLPSYFNQTLEINDQSISTIFSGTFGPDDENNLNNGTTLELGVVHGLYTGDSIVYNPSVEANSLGISTGIYFVKKVDETKIKLAKSRNNIFLENYVVFDGTVEDASVRFDLTDFTYKDLSRKSLKAQNLIRKISNPEFDNQTYETKPGFTGIFVNGVEVLNYKSKDNVYYGSIEEILPTNNGSGYDVINPPILTITDSIGSEAIAHCSVVGKLERIDIIDPGFDYLEEPNIEISGGNGFGALAKANLVSFDHEVSFNSQVSAGLVKLNPTNTIGFSSYHKFRDAEEVIYITDGQDSISGLSTNSSYFVSVQNGFTIKLHKSFSDAVSGINTIQLISSGVGNHIFKCKNKKKKIGSITIENGGSYYQNRLTVTDTVGINTSSDIITITNHGYQTGEIITYNAVETPIGGLSSSRPYLIKKINDDQFRLCEIGSESSGFATSFYLNTNQYVNLTSTGTGKHKFNYPEINVSVVGRTGISTLSGINFKSIVQPIFRGEIKSVFVESGGKNYGSEEIINYNRQPLFELNSGSGIQLTPIVSDGKIVDVLINSSGNNYNSPPNIEVIGDGIGAILTPIISNGTLTEVKIIYGGIGYNSKNTSIIVSSSGQGAKFESKIKTWKINLVEKLILASKIFNDDGILSNALNEENGLQYSHAYAPKLLRSLCQSIKFIDGKKSYLSDLQTLDGKEIDSNTHSPIIGWSYDGNPIYGPYGYSTKSGGSIKRLSPGYKKNPKPDRPGGLNESLYPYGFFVDDYEYTEEGDLDEFNGRFGITPEYPNGVYAYFTTVSSELSNNYKKPLFPYIIGPKYKSKPIDFNFDRNSIQDSIDINQTNWKRNTYPYNLLKEKSFYNHIINPNNIKPQVSNISAISSGTITSVGIITGGENYRIGDKLIFDSNNKFISEAQAKVSLLKGKSISQISVATSSYQDVVLTPYNQGFVGFTTIPHNYLNSDLITFTGNYDYKKSNNIIVNTNVLTLISEIGSTNYTGLVTYFNVTGNLNYPNIRENDIYKIGTEEIKVLNIDPQSSRIKVLRNQNGTLGLVTYSSGTILTEKTKRFFVNFGISTSYNFNINREFYFDPKESIGVGTNYGVGIVSTIYFSNPGVGVTQVTIPTKSIYLPNHNLVTGDILIYSSNGGNQLSVSTNGSSSFQLAEQSILYATKISNDLIGISTIKVGISSIGTFIGIGSTSSNILYFTSVGTGETHSFRTNYQNILKGSIQKNVVTVSTAETHGLSLLDSVIIDIKSGINTTFVVKYDDSSNRTLIDPKSFSTIDTLNNTILINKHKFYTGEKVLYTSNTPSIGLTNSGMYYVIVVDENTIMLSNSYYGSTKKNPEVVDISSSSAGTLSKINPPLQIIKNQSVNFDLSDSSLSFISVGNTYSAFDFKIYKDNKFINEFDTTQSSTIFEVSKSGKVGIDSTAKVTLLFNENIPQNLYYKLVPINLDLNTKVKKDIIVDDEVVSSSKISFIKNEYNGKYDIVGVSSNTFKFNVLEKPYFEHLDLNYDNIEYYTDSINASGSIKDILVTNKGKGYYSLPGITSVLSDYGSGAVLVPNTNSIGKILSTKLQDIGFDYSSDYSIRPTVKYPDILVLESLSTFDHIDIISFGKNYYTSPSLVVIDGLSGDVIKNVELKYSIGDTKVTIVKNTTELNSVNPIIIPTNNSNGIKIDNIVFNDTTKDVTVTLGSSFSDPEDFPFSIGSKVLIEGINVGIETSGKGYNSSSYNYALFTLTGVTTALGGVGAGVTYNLSSYLSDGEFPGSFSSFNSSGKIVPESYFPIFNPNIKKNEFYKGEIIYSTSSPSSGFVESWDSNNQYLKISTLDNFNKNEKIKGKTSNSLGIVKDIITYESDYKVDSTSLIKGGWYREVGFLNNDLQRVHDSDYYQYFSYVLKSKKDLNTWDNAVSTLNHTSGFKRFGNLIIESNPIASGISTNQNEGDFLAICDFSSFVSLYCKNDFDLAKENNLNIDGVIQSDEITFNSEIIQDYIESIGNRVLIIDNIENEFNTNERSTEFSIVDSFNLGDFRYKKYISLVQDKNFIDEYELSITSLIHNDSVGFINQYGNINSRGNLGSFDFNVSGSNANLLFYPIKTNNRDYHVELFSFSLNNVNTGIGTLNLGDTVNLHTNTSLIPQGTSTPVSIVGIASTYRSSKVLVQIGSTDSSYFEYDEITYIHNGTDVYLLSYGQLSTNTFGSESSSGIGTYDVYISGSNVQIDLIPFDSTTIDYNVNLFAVSIGNTSVSGIGTQIVGGSSLNSSSVGIASSSSPKSNIITSYSNTDYSASYSIITIEDKTNLQYQISELLTLSDSSDVYISEFGVINTNSSLGIITAGILTSSTNIYFTPTQNIDVDVKVFKVDIGLSNENEELSFVNGSINYNYGSYTGTENDIRKEFDLKHKNTPIFQRIFDANNSDIVNLETNTIKIPNHFYVTGEEVLYSCPNGDVTKSIGITTTSIPGIGMTDKLPPSLYIVKVNDIEIQVASSASEALKTIPTVLGFSSVGIGSSHIFTSKKQNERVIIEIDNIIQSPVVSTSVTTTISKKVNFFDSEIYLSGISSIYSGDLVKIDDEIMKVTSVGVGSTNSISVIRPLLGTELSNHLVTSTLTKVFGDFNIIENKIYFSDAPFGDIRFSESFGETEGNEYTGITTGSSFNGRVFLRSGINDSNNETYYENKVYDDISDQFDGTKKVFTLKSQKNNITGISTDNAIVLLNNIFQSPISSGFTGGYDLIENSGITSISFMGNKQSVNYDVNTSNIPRGGIILSVGSTQGFGYQPLVSAGGTAIVSISGTIQSISIGNSGSGYRSGIQTTINVGVKTENLEDSKIEFVGIASILNGNVVSIAITNPGYGYTSSNPPIVVFDSPLSYSNIPLIYSPKVSSGVGTGAVVDLIVGMGSSIISFELKNLGYAYKTGEILTVSIGGTTGIQTTSSPYFSEFQIIIDQTQTDKFASWSIGSLQVIDPLDSLFDGKRTLFPITINGNRTTIRSSVLTKEEVQASLLVFINDVLQVPGESYTFNGGSVIKFTESPKDGDKSKILFYRGTSDIDTQIVDILETIKVGDTISLNSDNILFTEDERLVTDIISSDSINTNLYPGPGISQDENLLRSLTWCKQTEDLFVNGKIVGKDRTLYEPYIQPISNVITNIGINTSLIFVESVKTFFDSEKEYVHDGISEKPQNKILIVSQDNLISAAATAIVSTSGTISSIIISNNGVGYSTSPTISISNPIGVGTTGKATLNCSITNGSVISVDILDGGFGYAESEAPSVLIESPQLKYEIVDGVSYQGDFGLITGISTTSVGVASTGIIFDFFIPKNSPLRDTSIISVGIATTGISGIKTGYYFVVSNSNVGNGLTSLNTSGGVVGVGTTFIDNIYQVSSVSIAQTSVVGVGITYVARVTVSVSNYNGLSGIGFSGFYGEYSWGTILTPSRKNPKEFTSYANTGGISTSPIIQRFNKLKYLNYNT